MESDFAKVVVAFIVIGIPMLTMTVWGITDSVLKHRRKLLEAQATLTAEKAAQYAAQTERLEQRVRVLERIVTDKGIVVANEIEKLRDQPLN
jgi:CHASE1-domain containing sensor protein